MHGTGGGNGKALTKSKPCIYCNRILPIVFVSDVISNLYLYITTYTYIYKYVCV